MPNATIDVQPEIMASIAAWLPSGITVVSSAPYGGAQRVEIKGDGLEDGKTYQLVVTNEPMRRIIELVKNPNQVDTSSDG